MSMSRDIQDVPYNVEAEEAVLGALLMDREAIVSVASFLRATDFYRETNGVIYAAVLSLYEQRQPADMVTLPAQLQRMGRLADVGGEAALVGLVNKTPTAAHIVYYARMVEHAAFMRRLIQAGGVISGMGYEREVTADEAYAQAQAALTAVYMGETAGGGAGGGGHEAELGEAVDQYYEYMSNLADNPGSRRVAPTGFLDLDNWLGGGLQAGELTVLGARPGCGKTAAALCIAHNAARIGKRVLFFSLEMGLAQLVNRLLAQVTGIDSQKLRMADLLSDGEWADVGAGHTKLSGLPLHIDATPGMSVSRMQAKAFQRHAQAGIDLVVVDYIQIVKASARKDGARYLEVKEVVEGVRAIARELGVAVLACAQLNRQVENSSGHIPYLKDFGESGAIEATADTAILIHREEIHNPDTDKKGLADFYFRKHRNGPLGRVRLRYDAATTTFQSYDPYRQEGYEGQGTENRSVPITIDYGPGGGW